jgi:Icc-related predicted phosphoesterase
MKIDCISDLHGFYPKMPGGDVLIVAGDLTAQHTISEFKQFFEWFEKQPYKEKILVGGNHDNLLEQTISHKVARELGLHEETYYHYLCDSGVTIDGFEFWGSPWTTFFEEINPKCRSFMLREQKLAEKFATIPEKLDVLITHGPPYGILDAHYYDLDNLGSLALKKRVKEVFPRHHIFGHIHEGYGMVDTDDTTFRNCSHVDVNYYPVNAPMTFKLSHNE